MKKCIQVSIFFVVAIFSQSSEAVSEERVSIGFVPISDHLTLGVAEKLYSADFAHTSLETVKFTDWATMIEALRSDSIDGAFLLGPLAFQAKQTGLDVSTVLLGHRDGSALIVKTSLGIKSTSDLKGKLVAIPSRFSLHNMLLHTVVSEAGLEFGTDVKTIELSPMEMPVALFNGDIDAYIVAEPIGAKAEKMGVGEVLLLSHDIWKHHPDCLLVLSNKLIKEHPEVVQELVNSLVSAAEFIEHDRDSSAKIGASFLGHSVEVLKHALTVPNTNRVTFKNLVPEASELERMQNYMSDQMKVFPKKIDIESFVIREFAEKAYQNLKAK